jgi:hypothetical protein
MSLLRHPARARTRALRLAHCHAVALAFVLAGAAACSDPPGSTREELPEDVSAQVGVKGGQLRAAGVTLEIPAGALEKTLKITATNVGKTAPSELHTKQLSDTYEFGPEGTKFNKDVTVTFPNKTMNTRAEVYFTKEGGQGFEIIKSEKRGDQVVAKVKHFSQGFLGLPLEDELDAGDDAGEDTPEPEPMDAGSELDTDATMDADAASDAGTEASDSGAADASAPDSALPTTHIVVHARDVYGALVNQTWAAFQDGTGAWQVLPTPATAGVYEFDVVSNAFAVALVCSSVDQTNSWGTLRYATTASTALELGTPGSVCTVGTPATKHTLSGRVSMPSGYWYWRYGHAHESSNVLSTGGATTTPNFTLTQLVHDEPNDVLFTTAPGTSSYMIGKIAVRRDVRPTADLDAGVDFDLVDGGVAPQGNAQVQLLGASGDAGTIDVQYLTRATETGLRLNTSPISGAGTLTASFATLPESIRRSTDLYFARGAEESATQWRRTSLATYPSGALTLTLPANFAITFAALGTPYLRPTFDFARVANARKYVFNLHYSPSANSHHRFDIELDPSWQGGTGQVLWTFPDLSPLPGFNTSWVAPSAASISASAAVHTFSSDGTITLKSESGQSATVAAP